MSKPIENINEILLDKAKDLITMDGYDKFSMRKLASICDIGLGTIYNYYPAKKDLVIAIMVRDWSQCILSIEKDLDMNKSVIDCINHINASLKNFFSSSLTIWLQVNMILRIQDMHHYMEMRTKFISIINNLLHYQIRNNKITLAANIDIDEFSKWLAENLITISHSSQVNYETFIKIVSCIINPLICNNRRKETEHEF